MKAAIFEGPGKITVLDRPDPKIENATDAVVRVVRACVCGSDLWFYRGQSERPIGGPVGHEFIGVIEETGSEVKDLKKGDFVIAPFRISDGTCVHCQAGITPSCVHAESFTAKTGGGQGEAVRVPHADGTLVKVPEGEYSEDMLKSFMALSDVMCTGYHAAVSAGVKEGDVVAVVGDGAVGLCAVLSAKLLGAKRIIALSKHPDRQALAKEFGATDVVEARGDAAVEAVMKLTDNVGVNAALECVGTNEAMQTAFGVTRPGGMVGFVGMPHDVEVPIMTMLYSNVGLRGGVAPARVYIPKLLPYVLSGKINPGRVFDYATDLEHTPEAYKMMDERKAIKALLKVSELS